MYDGLGKIYRLTSDKKNLYDSPWSDPSSELLLKKGKNYIWCENLNQIHISDSSNSKIETTNLSKGEINSKNYSEILKEKFVEIKKQATILKILNSSESNKELKTLITNIETFEKQITGNSNNKYYLCEQIKKIEESNFQEQSSDELVNALQKIDEELGVEKENERLKKEVTLNELFLCPQCLKKSHYLFHLMILKMII